MSRIYIEGELDVISDRLYIDGELVDIDKDVKITLDVKSNLFRDVSKITSNSTYTVKLPKTVRNQMILKHTDIVQSVDGYPYEMHEARYVRNGAEIIADGKAVVMGVTDESIEVTLSWGLIRNLSELISKGTKLNDMASSDRILFTASNSAVSYEDAMKGTFFYADYDVYVHDNEVDYDWKSDAVMTSPDTFSKDSTSSSSTVRWGGSRSSGTSTTYTGVFLHPVVRVPYVLDLIKENTGIDFQFTGDEKTYIDSLVMPLVNKKSSELTFDGNFSGTMEAMTGANGVITVDIAETTNVFKETVGSKVSKLTAAADANVIFDISAEWSWDNTDATPSGTGSSTVNGVTTAWDSYYMSAPNYIKMTVVNGTETNTYVVGATEVVMKVKSGYKGEIKSTITGKGKVEVKSGGTVTFELYNAKGVLHGLKLISGSVKTTLSTDDDVPNGGYFPIAKNLPDMKIIDFVKFLAVVTGTFPKQVTDDGSVVFVPLSKVYDNIGVAKDWSRRLIAQSSDNKPKEMDFTVDGYAQKNYYKWKEDDTVKGSYDGVMVIGNDTIDEEATIMEFPFAASYGNNVPMYSLDGSGSGTFGSSSTTDTTTTTTTEEASYSAPKDRIMNLVSGNGGKASCRFDIDIQKILDEKYKYIRMSLEKAKIVKEDVRMRDSEILSFDETVPVYLAQYGSYFAVTEIKTDTTGTAEVTMIKLYTE